MEGKEALLIINPVSGTRSKHGLITTVMERLSQRGVKVKCEITKGKGDASRMASEAAAKRMDFVISAGGDGTVNEIANSLSHTSTALGIIPLGSGNGLARSLGIPQDVNESLKVIEEGHILTCDRGIVNDFPFYCTFGLGFDAAVSEKFATMKRRGKVTYVRSALREFLRYRSEPYVIATDGNVLTDSAFLIAVCNAPQYGNNAYIAPKAQLSDGLLDITVVHKDSTLMAIKMGVDLMTGYLDRNTGIKTLKIKEAKISRLSEGPVHLDGEPMTLGKTLHITCDPGALRVFAPEKEPVFKPIVSPLRAMFDDIFYDMMARLNNN